MIDNMNYSLLQAPPDNTAETVATDMEGTLSAGSAWQGMRDYLMANGRDQAYKRFFLRRMPIYALHKLGLVSRTSMKEKWILGLLSLYKSYDPEQMAAMGHWVVNNALWPDRRRGLLAELAAHRAQGRRVVIVTGQFVPVLSALLARLEGFEAICSELRYQDGRFTGRIQGDLVQGPIKARLLQPFARQGMISAAYGDTADDIPMLAMSRRPVAVHPDQDLRRHAQEQGWHILNEEPAESSE